MADPKNKLTVLHPHRDAPKDIAYRTTKEYSFCRWCRFHKLDLSKSLDNPYVHRCKNRYMVRQLNPNKPNRTEACIDANPYGDCERFEPSLLTRLIRFFAFGRKPVFRDGQSSFNKDNEP